MEDLGLEPIDDFIDDVFAGLDDHPSGPWHLTLSQGPPSAATHHHDLPQANIACDSASSSCLEGLALHPDDMLPAPELPLKLMARLDWQQQQPEPLPQQQEHHASMQLEPDPVEQQLWGVNCTAVRLYGEKHSAETAEAEAMGQESAAQAISEMHVIRIDSTAGKTQSRPNAAAADDAAVTDKAAWSANPHASTAADSVVPCSASRHLQCSAGELDSSRGHETAPAVHGSAEYNFASSMLIGNTAAAATGIGRMPRSSSSSSNMLQCQAEQPSNGLEPESPGLPVNNAAAEADRAAAALLDERPVAAAAASSPSSASSVPDIDDVSEEQPVLASEQECTHTTELQPSQQPQTDEEPQVQQPAQELVQAQCQHGVPAAAVQPLHSSWHEQLEQMQVQAQLQLLQVQDISLAALQPLSSSTQQDCCGSQASEAAHPAAAAASAAIAIPTGDNAAAAAAAIPAAVLEAGNQPADRPEDVAAVAAAAMDAECQGLSIAAGELADFASPNASWHSCMTTASSAALTVLSTHAGHSAHAAFGAGSTAAAAAQDRDALAALLPRQQQQVHQQSSRTLMALRSRGGSSSSLPAATPPLDGALLLHQERQQQQQAAAAADGTGSPEDEVWQDVFPPSLGSSPATSEGFAALAAHSAAVAAAQALARRAAAASAGSADISSSPATAAGFTAITAQHFTAAQAAAAGMTAMDGDKLCCSPATAAGFTPVDRVHGAALQPSPPPAAAVRKVADNNISSSPATAAGFTAVSALRGAAEPTEGEGLSSSPATAAGFTTVDAHAVAAAAAAVEAPAATAASPAEGANLSTSPATAGGFTAIEASHVSAAIASPPPPPPPAAAAADPAAAASGEEHDSFHEGHGVYYYASPAACMQSQRFSPRSSSSSSGPHNPYQPYSSAGQGIGTGMCLPFVPYHGLYPGQASAAASTYVLRQSEMVDLSLSTSVHPAQQLQQQMRPGWLMAHQQLPPAAAQAVERAVVALNDSYFYHGRPEHGEGSSTGSNGSFSPGPIGNAVHVAGDSSHRDAAAAAAAGAGLGASGVIGMAIRRAGTRQQQQWSHAHTHPQQDQQARHRLPSQHATSALGPFSGWQGPTVLGQWFSSTVQQQLAAATGRVAAGVGQRPGSAAAPGCTTGAQSMQPSSASSSHCSSSGRAATSRSTGAGSGGHGSCKPRDAGGWDVGWGADSFEDAVLVERTPDMPQTAQEQEDEAFRGLLFLGGRDSHGRPVVIVNTDAIPAGHNPAPRDAALAYILKKLTPVVTRGPYVLVMVAFQHGPQFRLLPGVWCVRAYHSLPRAFHKNVKHVILLQPSLMVRAGLVLLYPFVSSKAHTKIKQVQRLLDIEAATCGEVQVPHLGEPFLTALQHLSRPASAHTAASHGSSAQAAGGGSRTVPVPGAMQ